LSPTLANPAVSHPANPTDPKRRRVVGNGAGIVQRLGRRLTKPQMQVRLPLPASPFPFLNARAAVRRLGRRRAQNVDREGLPGGGDPALVAHDLRHRRISLLHLRGVPWARIGEFVGQRDLNVTANTYTHVLMDENELDYRRLLA
jgi:integrase